jgi:hypothetical protein
MLSQTAQKDLHKLAIIRVEEAINSVNQLLDNDEQALHLMMTVLSALSATAATHMVETMTRPDGKHPSMGEAYCRILSMLAAVQGLESKVLSEDEAKQAGLAL